MFYLFPGFRIPGTAPPGNPSAMPMLAATLLAVTLAAAPLHAAPGQHVEAEPPGDAFALWQQLALRLHADAMYDERLEALLRTLPAPSRDPMGRKLKELYTATFVPPSPAPPLPPGAPRPAPVHFYPGVLTKENAALCRDFLREHKSAFTRAEKLYGVPRDIAAALLFVETRLGVSTGKHNVFYTLASMAATRSPENLGPWLEELPRAAERMDWVRETMLKRSDWAYKELIAFLLHARANDIDMAAVPGSMYGAMGLCQFMPSSIGPYGADGNDDGVIDLFLIDDAVASLSNYLKKNGWKAGLSRAARHAVLRRYNKQDMYANTILGLADMLRGDPVGKPVFSKAKKPAGKKKPASGKAGTSSPPKKSPPAKQKPLSKTP